MTRRRLTNLTLGIALSAAVVMAQPQGAPPAGGDSPPAGDRREKIREKLSAYMLVQVKEQLQLSDEQSTRIAPLLQERERARRDHLRERRERLRELGRLAAEATDDDARLSKELAAYRVASASYRADQERREEAILALLSPRQQAGYLAFMERFPHEMRRTLDELRSGEPGRDGARRRRRGERPGRPPGAPDPGAAPESNIY